MPRMSVSSMAVNAEAARDAMPEDRIPGAWFAAYGDAASQALALRSRRDPEFVAEMIIGEDDREQETSTTEYPYSGICSLMITAANGQRYAGTGWLAGPRTVITAGHCVYAKRQGGWARRVVVSPGRNGGQFPLGKIEAFEFYSVSGWVHEALPPYDYAAIILPADVPALDTLTFSEYSESEYFDDLIHVVGYPGDKPPGTLWKHARYLERAEEQTLIYEIDTYGGNSGAPVIVYDDEKLPADPNIVVGIHNYGDLKGNSATRITPSVYDNLISWVDRYSL